MREPTMNVIATATITSVRAESAERAAPILPPAAPSVRLAGESLPSTPALPAPRIARRRSRLRVTLRPAAQAWQRRAARSLLSLSSQRRGGVAC